MLDRFAKLPASLAGKPRTVRLAEPHPFKCAAVESTTGDLAALYASPATHPPDRIAPLDPAQHLADFKPIPLLALHSESDRVVPIDSQRRFIDRLKSHYSAPG